MLTLSEAQTAICSSVRPAGLTETIPLPQSCGRFLATATKALVGNPVFDNSAMDGYALATVDLDEHGGVLPLLGESNCGSKPNRLEPGTTMRIFTGAPIPEGADTVVMQEHVERNDDKLVAPDHPGAPDQPDQPVDPAQIVFPRQVDSGRHIRRKGEDFHAGEVLYQPGHRLAPMDLALLSAAGVAQVIVFKRPRVLVIATGNELVAPGVPLEFGQIYESNKLVTLHQMEMLGAAVVDGGTVRDDVADLRRCLAAAVDYDFVITSGGVSVGDHDLVKQVFAELGTVNLWRVKIKPGKPVAFGIIGEHTHFFALPGNPVSSIVTFKLFVEPALSVSNHTEYRQLELNAIATHSWQRSTGRMEFLRARLTTERGVLMAQVLFGSTGSPGQGSHMLGTLRETNGLIKIGEDCSGFKEGDTVTAIPLRLDFQ